MKRAINFSMMFLAIIVVPFFNDAGTRGQDRFSEELLSNFTYRSLGPYRAGSWVTDIAVPDSPLTAHLYTFYVGTRNGGVWKTINNGTTFEPIFDDHQRLSIGAVALAPSNAEIVWVGTGEAYNCRSSNPGDGIYKSVDGGRTWQCMGLRDTQHIARILVHPKNPDIVYVVAMGHLFTPNEQRGIFKTGNGGKTWEKVLYINDKVGVIDLVMNLDNPEVLFAAAYEKYRYAWVYDAGGPESGIYKTSDGGRKWEKLSGGLPTGKIGRIGIDIFRANPDILYAVMENLNPVVESSSLNLNGPQRAQAARQRLIGGEVYRTQDAGKTWTKMNDERTNVSSKAAYSFNMIRVDPVDDQKIYVTSSSLMSSSDGGRTWQSRLFRSTFGDMRNLWIDPQNPQRLLLSSDGGVSVSYDGGQTCDHYSNLPLGEFYAVGVDMDDPYNIYGGLQDHESWKGPSNGWSGRITIADWVTVGSGDGMYNQVDPTNSRWLYNNTQFGGHQRVDQKLGTRTNIQPRRASGQPPYRFNWTPPIQISPHNPQTIYTGAEVLLRSTNRGDDWEEISPDLTTDDPVKSLRPGDIQYCTITTLSESPVRAGVIWVGTDDGRVQLTLDHGKNWEDITPRITALGGPENYWVTRVFAGNSQASVAYVSKTGYHFDDFRPFLYKTTDFGQTWKTITNNLPQASINVIVEDRKNSDLLFVGNDFGVFVSINGGDNWVRMNNNNMPSAQVRDLVIHPRENDLVVGTYGRGLYITDISPLQELNEEVLASEVHLFAIEPKGRLMTGTLGGNYHLYGDRFLSIPNERQGMPIHYYLRNAGDGNAVITITDQSQKVMATLNGPTEAGLNTMVWDMQSREAPGADRRSDCACRGSKDHGRQQSGGIPS